MKKNSAVYCIFSETLFLVWKLFYSTIKCACFSSFIFCNTPYYTGAYTVNTKHQNKNRGLSYQGSVVSCLFQPAHKYIHVDYNNKVKLNTKTRVEGIWL